MKAEIQHFFDDDEDLGFDIILGDDGLQVNLLIEGMTQFRINIDTAFGEYFKLKVTDHSTNEIVSVTELKDDEE
jgi:hypothetical protein